MARLHAHRKGKSGSTRPYLKANPEWVSMEKAEIEETIVRLHQEGLSTAAIGIRLRDAFGVPNVRLAAGRSVNQILTSKGVKFALPEDLASLIRRATGPDFLPLRAGRHTLGRDPRAGDDAPRKADPCEHGTCARPGGRGSSAGGDERIAHRERYGLGTARSPGGPAISCRRLGPPQADPRFGNDCPHQPPSRRGRRRARDVRGHDDVAVHAHLG